MARWPNLSHKWHIFPDQPHVYVSQQDLRRLSLNLSYFSSSFSSSYSVKKFLRIRKILYSFILPTMMNSLVISRCRTSTHLLRSSSPIGSSFGSLLSPPPSIAPGAGRNTIWRRLAATITPPTKPQQHPNPGNFINRPKDEMRKIARKGGQKGGKARGVGGFHNMDPGKQVRTQHHLPT